MTPINKSLVLFGPALIIILVWSAMHQYNDFRQYHYALAAMATNRVADNLQRFLRERQHIVDNFSQEHLNQLGKIIQFPEEESYQDALKQKLALFFPEVFTFTIADALGAPLVDDFDMLVGEACLMDLSNYAANGTNRPRIHPNFSMYHFDMVTKFVYAQKHYILFVSFNADILAPILKAAQAPGHEIFLIQDSADELIEITSSGNRSKLDRLDFRLSAEERARILNKALVEGTLWSVVDLRAPGLFTQHLTHVSEQGLIIGFVIVMASLVFLRHIRRQIALREKAENHKEQFISAVNHELRTPLTSIKGSLGLVLGQNTHLLNSNTHKLLLIAQNNTDRLGALVNDLLDVQALEEGKLSIQPEPVELHHAVKRAIEDITPYGRELDTEFQLVEHTGEIYIYVDPKRLGQILANLLSNAAKYGAPTDRVEVAISWDDSQATISVRDHGDGIAEEFKPYVFQRFRQADAGQDRKVGGTGLGLALVKSLVELQQGQVRFESDASGTCFYLSFPRLNTPARELSA